MKEWTREQWKQYHEIVEISHKLAREGAEKALKDVGLWPCSFGVFINTQERIGEAIRLGAIELIIRQNSTDKEWNERKFRF